MVTLGECQCQLVCFGLLRFRDVKLLNLDNAGGYESIKVQVSDERPNANAKGIGVHSRFAREESGLLLVVHLHPNREIAYAGDRPTEP